jgi:hypothetical protein
MYDTSVQQRIKMLSKCMSVFGNIVQSLDMLYGYMHIKSLILFDTTGSTQSREYN